MTRAEHLQWSKTRALEYVERGDYVQAVASMISDLGKHEGTKGLQSVAALIMLSVRDKESAKSFVEGLN